MISFEDIKKANETIRTTDIKGKEYAEVNQRIKAFRMVYPEGSIETELLSNENGICIFRAVVSNENKILGTGTAYEKENSSFINKTSYIENCETSAIGRALGMAGFGIDTSIASYEEVANAIQQQNEIDSKKLIGDKEKSILTKTCQKYNITDDEFYLIISSFGYNNIDEIQMKDYAPIGNKLSEASK